MVFELLPLAVRALTSERLEATKMSLSLRDCALCAFPPRLRRGDAKQEKRTGARVNSAPVSFVLCGERGIRTPGSFHFNSFQDCRFKPLTHLSFCLGVQRYIKKTFTQKKAYFADSDSLVLGCLEKNFHLKNRR